MKKFVVVFLALAALLLSGCTKEDKKVKSYLSENYDYDSTISALVYEPIEGEEEYGIQYRAVTGFDELLSSEENVLLYFYSDISTDSYGITAGIEDIAQIADGEIMVISISSLDEEAISQKYEIQKVPEFIIVSEGQEVARFDGTSYESWTMTDVARWISSNGYTLDYTKLG